MKNSSCLLLLFISAFASTAVLAATRSVLPDNLLERLQRHPHYGRRLQALPPGVAPEIGIIGLTITFIDLGLIEFETTVALRLTNYFASIWWNCVAAYSNNGYKDSLTKRDFVVPVLDSSLHTTENQAICVAQAAVTYNAFSLPSILEDHADAMLDVFDIPVEKELNTAVAACEGKRVCLRRLAKDNNYDPIIMGQIVAKLGLDFSFDDGWNQLGTDSGCEVNCRPYLDTTGYVPSNPVHIPPKRGSEFNDGWQPLLEDNGKGYFVYQEHVTPHAGPEGKLHFLPNRERNRRKAVKPGYSLDRSNEIGNVIERMANLTDIAKIEIEQFDNKLIVVGALVDAYIDKVVKTNYVDPDLGQPGLILSFERFVHYALTLAASDYDSVIIAWNEKVRYDLIRPTTAIKQTLGKQLITTWAPGGTRTFPAEDFEAYIRVMPHSEYVSGSACIFEAQKDFILGYLEKTGVSDPTDFPIAFPVVGVGESVVEPGLVPSSDIMLWYPDVATMARVGSDSRLNGGMHFEESVPAAEEVCSGVGTFVVDGAIALYQ